MTGAMQLAQQDLMQLIPDTSRLPIPEPSPRGHARAAANSAGNIRQGMPFRRTDMIPARAVRSQTRCRPPFADRDVNSNKGSITA